MTQIRNCSFSTTFELQTLPCTHTNFNSSLADEQQKRVTMKLLDNVTYRHSSNAKITRKLYGASL